MKAAPNGPPCRQGRAHLSTKATKPKSASKKQVFTVIFSSPAISRAIDDGF
jgi:hypothetical protein